MAKSVLEVQKLCAWEKSRQILDNVNLFVSDRNILSVIGPRGSGKSTLLRCINRLFEERPECHVAGQVLFNGDKIYSDTLDVLSLRRKIGMIFSEPTPFPQMSIFENVAIGLRLEEVKSGAEIGEAVEKSLLKVNLWSEVKSKLHKPPEKLSQGELQRLCMARVLVLEPKVILMDEPTSTIGLHATMIFEQLIRDLSQKITIIFTSSSRKQAARISDQTAFLLDGELIEVGRTSDLFMNPKDSRTEDYLTGRFG